VMDLALLADLRPMARRLVGDWPLPAAMDFEDLMQEGALGLLEASRRFRPDTGASLRTFAHHRMAGAMRDALRDADPLTRDHRAAVRCHAVAFHLDTLDAAAAVPAPTREIDDAWRLDGWLAQLPPRWRFVIERHYLHEESLAEIAEVCELSPGRVSQIKTKALARLRKQVA
jgi:RNA polymerase sigma factor (sigma-70 family)